jgi:RimJ/RimL family protein N-acetyltransferase
MPEIPELKTKRLLLRGFRDGDLDAVAAMCADPDVMRYLGDGRTLDRADAWRQMAMFVGHWTLRGFGNWAVQELGSGAYVGRVGLFYPEGWPGRELGWVLAREHWGKGYATEAAGAVLDHVFEILGWPRTISLIYRDNARSIRVAERLGAHLEGQATIRGHTADVWVIDREAWPLRASCGDRASRAGRSPSG